MMMTIVKIRVAETKAVRLRPQLIASPSDNTAMSCGGEARSISMIGTKCAHLDSKLLPVLSGRVRRGVMLANRLHL